MHVLFVHPSFPAQFGLLGAALHQGLGWRSSFLTTFGGASVAGVDRIGMVGPGSVSPLLGNDVDPLIRAEAVRDTARSWGEQPDVVVAHSGFGTAHLLPELWPSTPIVNLFEWWYRPGDDAVDHRPDWFDPEGEPLSTIDRNAVMKLDLAAASAGYCPTRYQRSRFPQHVGRQLAVTHDGIDVGFWRPGRVLGGELGQRLRGRRLLTYVSRGLEAIRGFDHFAAAARHVLDARADVDVVIVGEERSAYGRDAERRSGPDFVAEMRTRFDLDDERVHFVGLLEPGDLAGLLATSSVHVYLTVPFVLSWSLLNAMACGAPVVGSRTAPVEEVVADGQNGLLAAFDDPDEIAASVLRLLDDEEFAVQVSKAARRTVAERYGLETVVPRHALHLRRIVDEPGARLLDAVSSVPDDESLPGR